MRKYLTIFFVVMVGLLLRIDVAFNTELWGDESLTVAISENTSYYDLVAQSDKYYDKYAPSGYYTLLKVWMDIGVFHAHWFRLLSIILYLPTIYFIYKTAQNISRLKNFDIFSTFIFAVHPLIVNQGFQVRPYALALFFLSGGVYFLFKKEIKTRDLVFSAILLSLSLYSAYVAVWYLVVLAICNLFVDENLKERVLKVTFFSFLFTIPQQFVLIRNIFGNNLMPPGSLAGYSFTLEYIFFHIKNIFGIHFQNQNFSYFSLLLFLYLFFNTNKNKKIILFKQMSILILLVPMAVSAYFFPLFIDRNLTTVSLLIAFILAYYIAENLKNKKYLHLIFPLLLLTHYLQVSFSKEQFYFQGGLESFSNQISKTNGDVYFLSTVHQHTLTGYYFKKANIKASKIHTVFDDKNLGTFNATGHFFFVYSENCHDSMSCVRLKKEIENRCKTSLCTWLHPI